MKKILHKVRQQSPEFRLAVAFGMAFIMTGIIAVLWGTTIRLGNGSATQKSDTPGPIDALVGSVKNVVSQPKQSIMQTETDAQGAEVQTQNTVQIINVDDPNPQVYDETNPYQETLGQ